MADYNKFLTGMQMSLPIYIPSAFPLDSKTVANTKSEVLSKLACDKRSEALFFYIIKENAFFSFQGGIADSDFKKIEGGVSSSFSLDYWKDGKDYVEDDYAVYNREIYKCITAHTSSTVFKDDIANWELVVGKDRYSENITVESNKWEINHNLNLVKGLPTTMYVFDEDGNNICLPDIEYTDENNLVINFNLSITGRVEIIK